MKAVTELFQVFYKATMYIHIIFVNACSMAICSIRNILRDPRNFFP